MRNHDRIGSNRNIVLNRYIFGVDIVKCTIIPDKHILSDNIDTSPFMKQDA